MGWGSIPSESVRLKEQQAQPYTASGQGVRCTRPLLIFEHIPKTAGRTINWMMYRMFRPDQICISESPKHHHTTFSEVAQRLREDPHSVSAIRTHGGFAKDRGLPDEIPIRNFCFLRDPVARTISHYHSQLRRNCVPPDTSIESWVASQTQISNNLQTRYLSGALWSEFGPHSSGSPIPLNASHLAQAIENLESNVTAFGILEEFDRSLHHIRRSLNFPSFSRFYLRCNVSARKQYPESILRLVKKNNLFDIELYSQAVSLFQKKVARQSTWSVVDCRLSSLANTLFQVIGPVMYPFVAKAMGRGWKSLDRS